jgi:hypothetical protein
MKRPERIEQVAEVLPNDVAPDAAAPEQGPKPTISGTRKAVRPIPHSSAKVPVAKPSSIPRMSAVSPTSLEQKPLLKPKSLPRLAAVRPTLPTIPADEPPPAPGQTPSPTSALELPVAPPAPDQPDKPHDRDAPRAAYPSSFPLVERVLVLDSPPKPVPEAEAPVVTEVPDSTPEAPIAPVDASPSEDQSFESDSDEAVRLPEKSSSPRMVAVLLVVGVVVTGGDFSLRGVTAASGHASARVATAAPYSTDPKATAAMSPAREPRVQAAFEAVTDKPLHYVPEGMAWLRTSGAKRGLRIFVDRRAVGETPDSVLVRCGAHSIRIGSAGRVLAMDVPCRGEVALSE